MKPVSSSAITHIGYDPSTRVMTIAFKSGHTYDYADVAPEVHDAFVNADSIGAHFHQNIRQQFTGVKK